MNKRLARKPGRHSRRQLQDLLKRQGPLGAGELAATLGLTAMAVRQHLYAMRDEGLVSFEEARGPVGRPEKKWRLTAEADAFFPDGHQELVLDLLDAARAAFGQEGVDRLIEARARTQLAGYRRAVADTPDTETRLTRLAAARSREGYMASVQNEGDGSWLLVENHCPICSAARHCTGLCAAELETFRQVLGNGVEVERTDHILAGARRCAYRVKGPVAVWRTVVAATSRKARLVSPSGQLAARMSVPKSGPCGTTAAPIPWAKASKVLR